jgi:hypothetical protein
MVAKKGAGLGTLEIRALYTIPMLARAANVPPQKLGRLLRATGVELLTSGRSLFVPLSEIHEKIPPLWRSIVAAERARCEARDPPAEVTKRRP